MTATSPTSTDPELSFSLLTVSVYLHSLLVSCGTSYNCVRWYSVTLLGNGIMVYRTVSLLMTLSDLRQHAAHPVLDTFSEKTRCRRSLKIRSQNWEERHFRSKYRKAVFSVCALICKTTSSTFYVLSTHLKSTKCRVVSPRYLHGLLVNISVQCIFISLTNRGKTSESSHSWES